MKKIEAMIQSGTKDAVINTIKKIGVGSITVHQVQGQGAQDPPLVGQYFSRDMVICVVDDDPKLDKVLDAIASVDCTGTKCDGKVFVTQIDEAFDICTKQRGTTSV